MNYLSFRFQELERYDPLLDAETVCFMAITDKGTFHKEVACKEGAERRDMRKLFRENAKALMEEGREPCEVDIE